MNKNIVLATSLLLISHFFGTVDGSVPLCPQGQTTIFFANGILNTYETAQASQAELQIRLGNDLTRSEFECLDFSLSFNASSQEVLGDSTLQKAFAFAIDTAQASGQSLTTFSRRFWTALEGFAVEREWEWLAQSFAESAASVDRGALLLAPEAGVHAENYLHRIADRKNKVVVVGHSQGNFYANQSYFLVPSDHRSSLGLVAVATFDSFVAGQTYPYAYTTLFEDAAIAAAMTIAASIPVIGGTGCTSGETPISEILDMWPLCPNLSNLGASEDLLGHNFTTAYLVNGSRSERRIVTQVTERIALVMNPPTRFVVGDRVRIADVPMSVGVLNGPSGSIVGTQVPGSSGVVRSSPRYTNSGLSWYIDFDDGVDGWVWEEFLETHEDDGLDVRVTFVNNETCGDYGFCSVVLDVGEWADIASIQIEIDWGDGTTLSSQTLAECLSAGACQHLGNGNYRVWKVYAEPRVTPYPLRVSYGVVGGAWVNESFSANVSVKKALELNATPGDALVDLSWANLGADRYNVCRATQPVVEFDSCSVYAGGTLLLDVGAPPRWFGGLTNGTTYHFRVEAKFGKDRLISEGASATPVALVDPPVDGGLNDTGITWSGHATSGNAAFCDPVHPAGQDCHFGRDAHAVAGTLAKIGGGHAGFDFTKIANDGSVLPASAVLGSGPNDWACTRDNVTGLIWEVKVDNPSHLRDRGHTYTWYDTYYDPSSPEGSLRGVQNGGTCVGSACDTTGFVQAVNAQGLCGASDWRMPVRRELQEIVDYGRYLPAIDTGYFPNTPSSWFWSVSQGPYTHATDAWAWAVLFTHGDAMPWHGGWTQSVRLVRGGG